MTNRVEPWEDPEPLKPLHETPDEAENEVEESDDEPAASEQTEPLAELRGSSLRLKSVARGIVFGVLIAGVGWVIAIVLLTRDSLPLMTAADFTAAMEHWQEHKPDSYDLDLAVQVMLDGRVHVEVRHGEVTAMTRDGVATPRHTWDYWSVDGLLGVIKTDLDVNEKSIKANGGNSLTAPIFQQAKFDPVTGAPLKYRRGEAGGGLAGAWEITSLKPVGAK